MGFFGVDLARIAEAASALVLTYVVGRLLSRSLEKILVKTHLPEAVREGLVRGSKYAVYLIGLLAAVSLIGVDITSALLGVGAFSIAISFATSNLTQNLVSGMLVLGERMLVVGDEVRILNYEGRVIKVGIRTTIIEDKNGDVVYIPNLMLVSNPVTRRSRKNVDHI
jgi:small-conductance mechanosensitive channel